MTRHRRFLCPRRDRKGNVGLPDDQTALVKQLLAGSKPAIAACFGSPYLIERFPEAETWIAAFSSRRRQQRAAARALFGESAIQRRSSRDHTGRGEDRRRIAARARIP